MELSSPLLRAPQPGVWVHLGYYDGSSSCQSSGTCNFKIKCEVYDRYNHVGSSERTVYITGGGLNKASNTNELDVTPKPEKFSLSKNYPNPFNPTTTINYEVPLETEVILEVYDILGRRVHTLINGNQSPGYYSEIWDGCDGNGNSVDSGVYIYILRSNEFIGKGKMTLLK